MDKKNYGMIALIGPRDCSFANILQEAVIKVLTLKG
jgi:hypothetical protein